MQFVLSKAIPAVAALVGAAMATLVGGAALALWLTAGPPGDFAERVPGMDGAPADRHAGGGGPAVVKGTLTKGTGTPADLPGSWPRFRGANLDNISRDDVPLAREWPAGGPPRLWQIDLTEGYASAAVAKGRVYIHDYDRERNLDAIRCLSLADAGEIWRFIYPVKIKMFHGITRTIPTVTETHLVAFGPKCHVACLDPITGEQRWMIDLVAQHGATVPQWYAGQCPLVDGDRVILGVGGPEALLMAVEVATGKIVWKTPNPDDMKMTHSSVMPVEFAGKRMYVYCGSHGVVGVSADDGAQLWKTEAWRITIATVPTPLPLPGGRIFLTGGYNAGSLILQLKETDGAIGVEAAKRIPPKIFDSEQHTPVLYEGHLYAIRSDKRLACADLEGTPLWDSGADRFGLGPYLVADGLIFAMDDEARLVLAEATPTGYKKLAETQALDDGHDAWGPFALAGGRLILRDMTRMVCLDVRAK